MNEKINKKFIFVILIFVLLVLASALIIEYKFDQEPCNLCLYQRIPYFLSILLIAKIFFTEHYQRLTLLILSLIFIISSLLGFYHFGIEQDFFSEPASCITENSSNTLTKEEILKQLSQKNISCKGVSFKIFGFSLAAINTIFSFILSVIFIKMFKKYGKN